MSYNLAGMDAQVKRMMSGMAIDANLPMPTCKACGAEGESHDRRKGGYYCANKFTCRDNRNGVVHAKPARAPYAQSLKSEMMQTRRRAGGRARYRI